MFKNVLFRILSLLYINYLNCIIVLPVDTLPRDNYISTYNKNSPKDIMDQRNKNTFYTTFEIGSPVQKVPLLIKPRKNFYTITSVYPVPNITIDQSHRKFNFSQKFFEYYDFYNENKSSSCKINWCRESEYYIAEECCSLNDTFLLFIDINMTFKNIKNINFELMRNVEDNITGEIGLNIYDEMGRFYNTFLGILKMNNLITNYNWYFDFEDFNNPNGKIIIGSLPHEDNPSLFSEDDLFYTASNQFSRYTYMELKFDKVYTMEGKNKIYFKEDAELRYDSNIIIGDDKYKKYFLSKIDYLLKEHKCFNDSINDYEYYQNLSFYYCRNEEDIKNKLYNLFSSLYFYSNDLNKTFEIKSDHIFFIYGDYTYIQILFSEFASKWSLGKIFTLRHKFVFNQDEKKIGCYKTIVKKINKKRDYSLIIKISICTILSILLIILGIQIGKILYKSRKKRANELNDGYEYEYYEDRNRENIDNVNNNKIIN